MNKKLPDIKNGFVVFKGSDKIDANIWQARIKSALIEYQDNDKIKDIFYSAQDCLAERMSNNNIFSVKPYIYRTLVSEKGLIIEKRFFPISFNNFLNFKKKLKSNTLFNLHVKKVNITKKKFKAIHDDLISNRNLKDLYLNICFLLNNIKFSLIIPTNYINFSPMNEINSEYIQINQGDFFIKKNSKFLLSYIAFFVSNKNVNFEIISNIPNTKYFHNNKNSKMFKIFFSKLINLIMTIAFPIKLNSYFKKLKPKVISYNFFIYK